jgi:excisionase family DNA binding protein
VRPGGDAGRPPAGAPAPEPLNEPLLSPRELAKALGVPVSWVYSQAEAGAIPSFKLGKYRRFRPSEVAAWLAEQRR